MRMDCILQEFFGIFIRKKKVNISRNCKKKRLNLVHFFRFHEWIIENRWFSEIRSQILKAFCISVVVWNCFESLNILIYLIFANIFFVNFKSLFLFIINSYKLNCIVLLNMLIFIDFAYNRGAFIAQLVLIGIFIRDEHGRMSHIKSILDKRRVIFELYTHHLFCILLYYHPSLSSI